MFPPSARCPGAWGAVGVAVDDAGLRERIAAARRALDDVESALSALPPPRAHARVDGPWE
ncbi:hypothetical protein ACFUJR_23715 [Streptomyces sp. NPDC057271]|uniref:hypothetical protein n=1 Tax=unclassified Streptomyces TaxID=2593676 RepID=UPI00362B3A9C